MKKYALSLLMLLGCVDANAKCVKEPQKLYDGLAERGVAVRLELVADAYSDYIVIMNVEERRWVLYVEMPDGSICEISRGVEADMFFIKKESRT